MINKIDIFENDADLQQVMDFVADNAFALLDLAPEIFPISSRLALKAKQGEMTSVEPQPF